jgi:hypothetical protein
VNDLKDFSAARYMESFEARHSNHTLTAQVAGAVGISLPPLRMDSQVKYGLLSRCASWAGAQGRARWGWGRGWGCCRA